TPKSTESVLSDSTRAIWAIVTSGSLRSDDSGVISSLTDYNGGISCLTSCSLGVYVGVKYWLRERKWFFNCREKHRAFEVGFALAILYMADLLGTKLEHVKHE